MCALLTGSGIYFSALFKRTTTAVIMNIIFAVVIWLGVPLLLMLLLEMRLFEFDRLSQIIAGIYVYTIPFVEAGASMYMTARGIDDLRASSELTREILGKNSSPMQVTLKSIILKYFLST